MLPPRHILHVDMDAFFASIEQLDHPEYRNKPVLVGHDGPRGVVAAASYEARRFGCRSAMPIVVAKRLCPHAIIAKGRFDRYREISQTVHQLFERFTPLVEPVSIDEAYLDITHSIQLHGQPESIAQKLKHLIHHETHLTASVGVAPNKFLAKLASDMNKPNGMFVITPENLDTILPPLPIGKIHGIGPKTEERFHKIGIRTIAHLRQIPPETLRQILGDSADHYLNLAHGIDTRPVQPDSARKSIGHEQTFGTDLGDPNAVREILITHVEQVAQRLRRQNLLARRVNLKIRFGDFQTISRSRTLTSPTDSTDQLLQAAHDLFNTWANAHFSPVRLIGMSAEELTEPSPQLPLFPDPADSRAKEIDTALDQINARFGHRAIHRAGH